MTSKASQMLNLLRRNLSKCCKEIKSLAYLSLVHPILEYSSAVWDPYITTDVLSYSMEKIQRQAARWVTSDYAWTSSVTSMLNDLQWPTLSIVAENQ